MGILTNSLTYPQVRCVVLFLAFNMNLVHAFAQNLIPNGDFESGRIPCEEPLSMHESTLDEWYPAIGAGFYYSREECQIRFSPLPPRSGVGSLIITGALRVNGIMTSGFAINDFTEELEAGLTYYFEFYGRSNGLRHIDEDELRDCDLNPSRDLTFFIGNAEEEFGLERTSGVHLVTDVHYTGTYSRFPIPGAVTIRSSATEWQQFSTCYKAIGGESKIGISGPNGQYNLGEPCIRVTDAELDTFSVDAFTINRFYNFFYYEIDDIGIYEIPEVLEARDTICAFQLNTIDLKEYLPDNPAFQSARFEWEDGSSDRIRTIDNKGLFNINVIIFCKTVPLTLDIMTEECPEPFYVANIFSPNGDGMNDVLKVAFNTYYDLDHYQFRIFDRGGGLVYNSMNPDDAWNGDINNQRALSHVYTWILEYQLTGFSRVERRTGTVQVLR